MSDNPGVIDFIIASSGSTGKITNNTNMIFNLYTVEELPERDGKFGGYKCTSRLESKGRQARVYKNL